MLPSGVITDWLAERIICTYNTLFFLERALFNVFRVLRLDIYLKLMVYSIPESGAGTIYAIRSVPLPTRRMRGVLKEHFENYQPLIIITLFQHVFSSRFFPHRFKKISDRNCILSPLQSPLKYQQRNIIQNNYSVSPTFSGRYQQRRSLDHALDWYHVYI